MLKKFLKVSFYTLLFALALRLFTPDRIDALKGNENKDNSNSLDVELSFLDILTRLVSTRVVYAAPPGSAYTPGETLDPSCSPGGANCTVNYPVGGSTGNIQYNAYSDFGGSSDFTYSTTTGNLGIGTSSPYAKLSVTGEVVANNFTATSTSATSTLPNLSITNLLFGSDYITDITGSGLSIVNGALTSSGGSSDHTYPFTATNNGTSTLVSLTAGVNVGTSTNPGSGVAHFDGAVAINSSNGAVVLGDTSGNARGDAALDLQSGRSTVSQVASGNSSVAVGYRNASSGASSMSFGYSNISSGSSSLVLGSSSDASGQYSTAIGRDANASDQYALAIGYVSNATDSHTSAVGYNPTASAQGASSFGYANEATATDSSAFGNRTAASGIESSIFGYDGWARGLRSVSVGYKSEANATDSSAFGDTVISSAEGASSFGSNFTNYLANTTQIGPSEASKLTIDSAGQVGLASTTPTYMLHVPGNGYFSSFVDASYFVATSTTATSTFEGSIVGNSTGVTDRDFVFGSSQTADTGSASQDSRLFFDKSKSALRAGLAQSTQWDDSNVGAYSTAFGINNTASGGRSTAFGDSNIVSGGYATVFGKELNVSGNFSFGIALNDQNSAELSQANTFAVVGGNSGFGTLTPSYELEVSGDGRFSGFVDASYFVATSTSATSTFAGGLKLNLANSGIEFQDGTIQTTASTGSSVSFGSDNQIPYTNSSTDDFDYSSNLTFDGSVLTIGGKVYQTGTGQSTYFGYQAGLNDDATNKYNVAVGYQSLLTASNAAFQNTAVGYQSLYSTTGGDFNTASGYKSMYSNTTGNKNDSSGSYSLYSNTGGFQNTVSGYNAMYSNLGGDRNTASGYRALYSSTGNNNVAFGYAAGDNITSGSSNIVIGYNIDAQSATADNQLSIGNLIFSEGIDGTGTSLSSGNIGIGTTSPYKKLSVNGAIVGDSIDLTSGSVTSTISYALTVGTTSYGGDATLGVDGAIFSADLYGGQTTLSTDANGNIIRTPSDAKLKTNVTPLADALSKVLELEGVSYNWIDTGRFGEQTEIGLIAQEVEKIVPEVVRSGGEYKSLNYQNLVALLINAIKELNTKVDNLAASAGQAVDGIKSLVVGKLEVGSPSKPSGIVLYDEKTGDPYCLYISGGETKTRSGKCDDVEDPVEPVVRYSSGGGSDEDEDPVEVEKTTETEEEVSEETEVVEEEVLEEEEPKEEVVNEETEAVEEEVEPEPEVITEE